MIMFINLKNLLKKNCYINIKRVLTFLNLSLLFSIFLFPTNVGPQTPPNKFKFSLEIKSIILNPLVIKKFKRDPVIESFKFIKKWEGFKSEPYYCPAGHLTIGYGTLIKNDSYVSITEKEAKKQAINHLRKIDSTLSKLITVDITLQQRVSLLSFSYNLGIASLKRSTLLKRINSESSMDSVLTEFKRWNKIRNPITQEKEELRGLTLRRSSEADLWNSKNQFLDTSYAVKENQLYNVQ